MGTLTHRLMIWHDTRLDTRLDTRVDTRVDTVRVAPRIVLALLLIVCALLAGCGDGGGVHLDQSDNGKTITVAVGDEVVIALDENPTTGYTWAVEKIDDTILALKSSDYTRTGPPVSGAGGVRMFTFSAKQAGISPLELKDWRSWEGDKSVIGRYSLTIEVKSS